MNSTTSTHDNPSAAGSHDKRLWMTLAHRWPTLLGIIVAAGSLYKETDASAVLFLGLILFVAALSYLITAVVDRPKAVWLVVFAVFGAAVGLRELGIDYWMVLGPIALAAIVVGLIRGQLRRGGLFTLQIPAMLLFGSAAAVAQYLDPVWGGYLMAAGLFAHAAWDVVHWLANKVVARSLAEWCAVLDFLLACGILFLVA